MSLSVTISDKSPLTVSNQKIVAVVSVCSGSSIAAPVELERGADVGTLIGYGPGTTLNEEILAQSGQSSTPTKVIHQKITGGVAGVIGSVTETPSGTGPTITVAGAPYDTYDALVKITKGGPLGTATFEVALDGGTYSEEIPTVPRLPASFTSAVDLTTLNLSDLNGLTVIGTSDIGGPITITLTTPSSVQDIADQITAGFASGPDEAAARIVSGKYLQIYSLTDGSTSTLTFGAGTANALLGLTPSVTYTGSNSTYAISNTGMTITFPHTSDYVVSTVYSFPTTQPRFSSAAAATALATLRDWLLDNGVSLDHLFLCVDPVDGAETKTFADLLSTTRANWAGSPYFKYPNFYMGASLHTASATKATNDTNITASDADIKAAMNDHVDPYVTVCSGDHYFSTAFGLLRRSNMHWLALFETRERDSADPGNGSLEGFTAISMTSKGGILARNELTATHKMRAARFVAAKKEGADIRLVRGVTRANPSSTPKLKHLGVVNMGLRAVRLLLPLAKQNENTDPLLKAGGTIREDIADGIDQAGNDLLRVGLLAPGHASEAAVTVDRSEDISTTEHLTINASVQPNGQIEAVSLSIGVVATLS
jgi:hypothetical protein